MGELPISVNVKRGENEYTHLAVILFVIFI